MITAWRLVRASHAGIAFSGEGARLTGGRWNSVGVPMVYTSDSVTTAALEILAQGLGFPLLLNGWMSCPVTFPSDAVEDLDQKALPPDWDTVPIPKSTQAIGDHWIESKSSAVLKVPSAVAYQQFNYLLNPKHPRYGELVMPGPAERYPLPLRIIQRFKA